MGAKEVAEAAAPALSTLSQTVIGSLLVVSWAITIAAVWALIRVQNQRVQDQKEMSLRMETTHSKMVTAFATFKSTLEALARADETGQQALQSLQANISMVVNKLDMLIMGRSGGRG